MASFGDASAVALPRSPRAALLALEVLAALRAPEPTSGAAAMAQAPRCQDLLKNRNFLCIVVSPALAGVLWSESVASEVLVFFFFGPFLLQRLPIVGGCVAVSIELAYEFGAGDKTMTDSTELAWQVK